MLLITQMEEIELVMRAKQLLWQLKRILPWCNPLRYYWVGREHWREWCRFWLSFDHYVQMCANESQKPQLANVLPCRGEDKGTTPIEPIYFYQNSWAFEHIVRERPDRHVDVGSHHSFVSLLSKVVPVTMVDIRPLSLSLESLQFVDGSILDLPYADQSQESVSSICVVEHIGLGRYGDPLDPNGTEKAIDELKRIVAPGGFLYISLPLDDQTTVYFNAHRAFAEADVLTMFAPFELLDRKYIYGNRFGGERGTGFGTGCYKLRRSL